MRPNSIIELVINVKINRGFVCPGTYPIANCFDNMTAQWYHNRKKNLGNTENPAWQIIVNKGQLHNKGNDFFKYELGASNIMDCRSLMPASNDNVAWN